MALWEVNGEIVYSKGALSITPSGPERVFVNRHYYKVPYSNIGIGSIFESKGKTYHVPSWLEVHPQTTIEDIIVEKKPFEELFVEPKSWTFKSDSSDKEYTVKEGKNGLHCSCWGYMSHKKCKHIKHVKEML
jgi:hypothetical protein